MMATEVQILCKSLVTGY